jgi:NADH-quinone oxidoreductase subunit M
MVAIIVIIVGIGIYPGPWIEIVRPASEAWANGLGR